MDSGVGSGVSPSILACSMGICLPGPPSITPLSLGFNVRDPSSVMRTQPVNVNVRVPRQQAPVVNGEAPIVNVQPAAGNVNPNIDVIVPPAKKPKKATITHADGTVSEVEMS